MSTRVDLVIQGNLVNVHTGTIEERTIAIDEGVIVALEERPARKTVEAEFITPGLIDAHVHIESSMITLPRYGEAVVPKGVTSIVHDPHEIANVLGEEGVRAVIKDAQQTPLKARFTVPSSVPASFLQEGGATIEADAVERLLESSSVVGLAEVMDITGVVEGQKEVHDKIEAAVSKGLTVDGHLPRVSGSRLQEAARYLDTDHESISLPEAREKADLGIHLHIREGSTTRNVESLLPLLEEIDSRYLSFCSDDRKIIDLVERGGVNFALQKAIANGADPVTAIQMATINTADRYDLPFGRVTPGAPADLVLLEEYDPWTVDHVIIDGEIDPRTDSQSDTNLDTNTVHFDPLSASDLTHSVGESKSGLERVRAIQIGENQTGETMGEVPVEDGALRANVERDILPIAVVDRHRSDNRIGTGFVNGFGLTRGAIASTVAHDAHNLIVTGVSHESMARAANRLSEVDGGFTVYDPSQDNFTTMPLPVAGLMSDEPLNVVADQFNSIEEASERIGLSHPGGFMELTFLALEVIPELRITSSGLVDVREMEYADVVLS